MCHLLTYLILFFSITVSISPSGVIVSKDAALFSFNEESQDSDYETTTTTVYEDQTLPPITTNDTIERAGLPPYVVMDPILLVAIKDAAMQENDGIEKVASCNSCSIVKTNLTSANIVAMVNSLLQDFNTTSTTTTRKPSEVSKSKLRPRPTQRPELPDLTGTNMTILLDSLLNDDNSTSTTTTTTTMKPKLTTTRRKLRPRPTRRPTPPPKPRPSLRPKPPMTTLTTCAPPTFYTVIKPVTRAPITRKPTAPTASPLTRSTKWYENIAELPYPPSTVKYGIKYHLSSTKVPTRHPTYRTSTFKPYTLPTIKVRNVTSRPNFEPLNAINTKIFLYTRRNQWIGQTLVANEPSTIELAHQFNCKHPTRFIIHGSFDYSHWMKDMKDKLLENEDSNVIVVDWSAAASKSFTDIQRLSHSRDVGFQITAIVQDFMRIHGLQPADVHIIAYGDGTFAADVVGQRINNIGRPIGRISGLNPSGPVPFEHLAPDQRLDRTDAMFVDIIHTDDVSKSISPAKKGTPVAIGDVDFYPNGGVLQPGCSLDDLDDLFKKMIKDGLRELRSCSPYRAIDYYIESISNSSKCLHMAYECPSYDDFRAGHCGHYCNDEDHLCSEVGFRSNLYFNPMIKASRNEPIKLFYSTARKKPFCLFHYNVQINVSPEPSFVRGGILRMRIEGQFDGMDVKLNGPFKSGFSSGLLVTSPKDLGLIRNVSISWVPSSVMTLFYSERLFVEDVRVAQIQWNGMLKTEEVTTLCPVTQAGIIKPFYGFLYKHDHCFKYHKR